MRIYHGPKNIAGIGAVCAALQREKGHAADFIVFKGNALFRRSDMDLRIKEYGSFRKQLVRLFFLLFALARYDVFHFYFGRTLLWKNVDLPILKLFGKKIVMTYCGSDARLVALEEKRNPYAGHLRHGLDHPGNDHAKIRMMKRQSRWVDRVTAPRNQYAHVRTVYPESKIVKDIWIHNMIEVEDGFDPAPAANAVPVIVHAPTSPEIKGTAFIEKAIESLKARGLAFEYRRVEGVTHDEALKIYRGADIFVDQLLVGGFGTFAVEGMYLGKPVCCYLLEEVRREFCPDCPVVDCTIESLEENLARLIEDPAERARIGAAGHAYAKEHFDASRINDRLLELYSRI